MNNEENNIANEIWKSVDFLQYRYLISNHGRLKHYKRGKIRKTHLEKCGYERICLKEKDENKTPINLFVHRLVAYAFIQNPENKPCVNHKDGNKLNNHVSNLEWVNSLENNRHAIKMGLIKPKGETNGNAKLTEDEVKFIRAFNPKKIFKDGPVPKTFSREIAEAFNTSISRLSSIWNRKQWTHI